MASFGNVARTVSSEGDGEAAWAGIVVFDHYHGFDLNRERELYLDHQETG